MADSPAFCIVLCGRQLVVVFVVVLVYGSRGCLAHACVASAGSATVVGTTSSNMAAIGRPGAVRRRLVRCHGDRDAKSKIQTRTPSGDPFDQAVVRVTGGYGMMGVGTWGIFILC